MSGTVTLADDLSCAASDFQDFVIVHELLHLRVPNRGKLFKALMSVHVPDWRRHDIARRESYACDRTRPGHAAQARGEDRCDSGKPG